jgi:LmbE family N-acetylglucosaminyl deacetylase
MEEENMKAGKTRVLAVEAHPDDVEFMCSGTLALLKQRGYDITICSVANGDCGSMTESQETITKIRREEAIRSAQLLEAEFIPIGERDLKITFDDVTKRKLTECLRSVDPFIVFTHPHEDYMADHEITSRLVRAACFAASIPNYFSYSASPSPRTSGVPYLYYWSPMEGKNIYGDFVAQRVYVDISTTIETKAEMLKCHASQRDWLMEQHGMDKYIETMRSTAEKYGDASGFEYAEGFVQHRGNAYPQDNILQRILGVLCRE